MHCADVLDSIIRPKLLYFSLENWIVDMRLSHDSLKLLAYFHTFKMSSQQFNGLWDGFWNFLGGSWRVPQFWITSLLRQPSTVIVGVVIALCKTVWASIGKDRRNFESCQVKLSQNSQAKLRYSKISSTLHSFDGLYTGVNMSLQFQISGFGRQMGIISHWLLKNLNRIIMIKLLNLLLQDSF